MVGTWYVEVGKYKVMPVDGRGTQRFAEERPQIAKDRTSYTFYPGTQSVPAPFYTPPFEFTGTIHSVTIDVSGDVIKDDDAELRAIMARQ